LFEEALTHFGKVTVMGVWVPGNLLKTLFGTVNLLPVKKVIARQVNVDSLSSGKRSSILLDLVVLQRGRVNTLLGRSIFRVLATFFRAKLFWMLRTNDLLIIPADIWDLVPHKNRKRVVLEVRWLAQNLIDSLDIPKMTYHQYENVLTSGIPVIPPDLWQHFFGFFTYSEIAKESLIISGADPRKILVIPLLQHNALAISNEIVDSRSQRLLYVGRSAPEKRLDLAVEIAEILKLPLDVVGKYDALTIEWLNMQPGVCYIGELTHNELLDMMHSNLALLAPGVESWGLVVVEALQSGMSVYASRFTGVTEWIDHPNLHVISEMSSDMFVKEFRLDIKNSEAYKIFVDVNFESRLIKFLTNLGT
jgi:glycosyltransferase involved in cell wall biosynthesis